MTLPAIVEDALNGAAVASRVSLSGDDEVFVTADRTIVYRAGGVLSDESVEVLDHEVDRLIVSEGRRKATITFEYAVADDRTLSVPNDALDATLQPVLAAVLRHRGATDPDERFRHAFRFSEMTVVVTDERLLKHVGAALWDGEYDAYHFEDVTDLTYERGDVATGVVLTVDDRKERIKTPNDRLPEVQQELESALFSYHGVDGAEELSGGDGDPEGGDDAQPVADDDVVSFGSGVDPLDAGAGPGRIDERSARATESPATDPDGDAPPAADSLDPEPDDATTEPRSADAQARSRPAEGTADVPAGEETERRPPEDAGPPTGSEVQRPADEGPERSAETTTTDDTDQPDRRGSHPGADVADPASETTPEPTHDEGSTAGSPGGDTAAPDADDAASADDAPATPFTEDIEPAGDPELAAELRDLRAAVERQNELLGRQQRAIERLIEELRDG